MGNRVTLGLTDSEPAYAEKKGGRVLTTLLYTFVVGVILAVLLAGLKISRVI
jgi:hypothetical protein